MRSFSYTVPVTVEIKHLTVDECKQLTEEGCTQDDVKWCDDAVMQCKYTHIDEHGKRRRISCKKAREILGEKKWFSGISRAAFHVDCHRDIDDNDIDQGGVDFDCRSMFRR